MANTSLAALTTRGHQTSAGQTASRTIAGVAQLRKQIYKRQMKVKILLAFIQVGSQLQGTFRLKMPPVVKNFLSSMQVLEFFDVFSMILKYVSCAYPTDYYTKVYMQV